MPTGITLGALVEATRRHLYGDTRQVRSRLDTALTAADTDVVLTGANAELLRDGANLGIGYEQLYVYGASGQTADCARADAGTVADEHDAGVDVEIDPRWTRGVIWLTLLDEIRAWPDDIGGEVELDVDFGDAVDTVEVAVGTLNVSRFLRLLREPMDDEEGWQPEEARLTPTAASTTGWHLTRATTRAAAYKLVLATQVELPALTTPATDLEDLGMTAAMSDIPPLGVVARLVPPNEVVRSDSEAYSMQGDPSAHPAGASLRTGAWYLEQRDRGFARERRRLAAKYGTGTMA